MIDTQPSKLLRVATPDGSAAALWVKGVGGWRCWVAAPVLAWMRGREPAGVKAELESRGWAYSWH